MTNEIKEILDNIKTVIDERHYRATCDIDYEDCKILLDYITNLQEKEKEMIIQSNALSHYLIKQGSSYKDVVKIVDDFKLQGEEIMNDKIVPAIIENEGIKYIAIRFHIDAIDENRMLWTENEKLLQRIDKANSILNKLVIMKPWENDDDPMRKIYRPIKNTTKQQVYRAIVELEDILRGDE